MSSATHSSALPAHATDLDDRLHRIASRIAPAVRDCVDTGGDVAAESTRLARAGLQRWQELRETYSNDAEPTWSRLAALSAATQRGFYNQRALLAALEAALKEEAASSQ